MIWPAVSAGFLLGFALARANSCTVASTRRLILEGRADWLLGLGVLISWAGLTLLAFAIAAPHQILLPAPLALGLPTFVGAVLLGIGATLNQGCFLGSVAQLGRGNLNYLLTLAGVMLALACADLWTNYWPVSSPDPHSPDAPRWARDDLWGMLLFLPLAIYGLRQWVRSRRQTMLALIGVGVSGGAIYAFTPNWSYTAGLERAATGRWHWLDWPMETTAIAMLVGALVSSALRHQFKWRWPTPMRGLGCLVGGLLMGIGAKLIPGGNDGLMLWSIPGLTIYGPVAYAVMIATIAGLIHWKSARSQ